MAGARAPGAGPSAPGPPDSTPGSTTRPATASPATTSPATTSPATSEPPPTLRERWLTPGGLSAIAAIVGCLVALVSLILTNVIDLRPDAEAAAPSAPSSAQSPATTLATNQLFVYGSTKPGQPRYEYIQRYVADKAEDSVTGYLYASGQDYPVAKFGPGEPIAGWVLTIHDDSVEEFFTEMTQMESGLFALKQGPDRLRAPGAVVGVDRSDRRVGADRPLAALSRPTCRVVGESTPILPVGLRAWTSA